MATNVKANSVYAEDIFRLAKGPEDKVFYNSSAEHAVIVHQALVKYATEYIYIFSSSMCSEISNNGEYIDYMREFLDGDANRKIHIVLTDYNESFKAKPIAQLLAAYPSQVAIKQFGGKILYNGQPAHFTVTDDRAFRLETNIKEHMAFGNFNAPEQAKPMRDTFEKIFDSGLCKSVNLC